MFKKHDPEKETEIMLGDPRKAIRHVTIPFLISMIIGQINMLADVAWCSGLGSDAVAAIQAVNPLYWVIFDVGLGIGLGCNVVISRHIGAGDRESAKNTIIHGIILSTVVAMVTAPFLYLSIVPLTEWMGAGEVSDMGVSYLTPILVCNLFQVLSPTLSGFLRGEGAARRSNYAMIAGTVTNIIIDPILIYGLDLGVTGAGIATATSMVISTVIMLYFYLSRSTTIPMTMRGFRFDGRCLGGIMYIGLPKITEMFLMDILDAINRVFLIECAGIDGMVLFAVPFRLTLFAVMIPNSLSMAMTPVASANIGAKRMDKSRDAFTYCIRNGLILSAVLAIAYLLLAHLLVIPFTLSDSMVGMRSELTDILRVMVLLIPAIGTIFICNGMLQAMRMPVIAMLITFSRTGLTTLMFMLFCDTSVLMMCAGMACVTLAVAVAAFFIARKGMDVLSRKEMAAAG